ncbi:MAG TPA: GNAT family N-acetyltransferase [Gemmatimonadaceae bacterium]|jgi:hypothetical protein
MTLHIAALFTHDSEGRMLRINEPDGRGGIAPRFLLGQTRKGSILRFRADVDADRQRELQEESARMPRGGDPLVTPLSSEHFCSILERDAPITALARGPAFVCPEMRAHGPEATFITPANAEYLRPLFPGWLGDVSHYQPMVALVDGDQAVSLCCSVRRTGLAHEAGLETAQAARGRGYALVVVAAWVAAVYATGRVPLYSTSWDNIASRVVARKLGLIQFGNDLHIT